MAVAGAFAPLADDATAAFANPAGLVQLVRPELSVELRLRAAIESDEQGKSTLGAVSGVSFFSAVIPLHGWSLALYGHKLASLDFGSSSTGGSGGMAVGSGGERLDGIDVGRLGLSVACQLRENLSIGLGVSYFDSALTLAPTNGPTTGTRKLASNDWAANAGVLWSPSELLRIGAFYRDGPRLAIEPQGTPPARAVATRASRSLDLPDAYGAGAAFRSRNGALTVAVEWDHVRYASLLPGLATLAVYDPELSVADADEAHVGAEYAFLKVNPVLAARAGAWYEPDHRVCSTTTGSAYQCADGSAAQVHVTAGFGVAFRRFQLDIGVDQSRELAAFSISGILSF
jgi:long-chain fatty acid transport protein